MTDPLSNIKLAPRAIRDLKNLDRQTRKRVQQALQALGADAANLDVKPVAGHALGVACTSVSTACSTASSPTMLVPFSTPGESHLSDRVVEEGVSIGYQDPNGIFPGCECDSATVELDLYIESPKASPPEEATSVN
jgi:hypothetical protein